MERFDKILLELERNIKLINLKNDSKLREWSINYFNAHKNRYKSDLTTIEYYYRKGHILEIGSLPCHLTFCLKKLGYPIKGLDINPERARSFINKHNLDIIKCDIEKERIPYNDNSFNFIIFNELLEHLRVDPIFSLKEINRILKSNGIMMLTTPNLYSFDKIIKFNIGRGFNNPYDEFIKLHTLGHMGHIREYSTREVKLLLERTGFKLISLEYKFYDKTKGKIGPFLDLCYNIFPRWRPFQTIICNKKI